MESELLPEWKFDGHDYDHGRDCIRLTGQLERVFECLSDGEYKTFDDIRVVTGDPVTSISAQIRNLRKDKFGGHTIDRMHCGNGLYKYRMTINAV